MHVMNPRTLALSSILGAVALAAAGASLAAPAADKPKLEKCFGVAKAGKNDCASGAHSCAGTATQDFDKTAYVALPAGICEKLAGGSLTPGQ